MSLDGEDHGEGQNNRHRDELQKARYLSYLCAGIEEYKQCPNWVLGPLVVADAASSARTR